MSASEQFIILRELVGMDPGFVENIADDGRLYQYDSREDGESMWVNNDLAWDATIADQIVSHTGRFALADLQGGIVAGPWRSLDKATAAKASAKVVTNVDLDLEEELGLDHAEAEHQASLDAGDSISDFVNGQANVG